MSNELSVQSGFTKSLSIWSPDDWSIANATVVKTPPQGGTRWQWSDVLGEYSEKALVGVVVAIGPSVSDLWPSVGKATKGSSPYLRSIDGRVAHRVGDDPGDLDTDAIAAARLPDGTYDCSKLVYFQWSETADGRNVPPRASRTRRIAILREGEGAPLVVRLSKTSTPVLERFFQSLRSKGVAHYAAVVSLGLESVEGRSASYSRIVPKFVSRLDDETAAAIKSHCTDAITPQLGASVTPVVGNAVDAETDSVPF